VETTFGIHPMLRLSKKRLGTGFNGLENGTLQERIMDRFLQIPAVLRPWSHEVLSGFA
jgi:hypothetical protein